MDCVQLAFLSFSIYAWMYKIAIDAKNNMHTQLYGGHSYRDDNNYYLIHVMIQVSLKTIYTNA